MGKKPSLQDALLDTAKGKQKNLESSRIREIKIEPKASTRHRTRIGKVNISGWFPEEVQKSVRLVQAKRGGKIQELLAEALNDLFAKYNVPETAPVKEVTH